MGWGGGGILEKWLNVIEVLLCWLGYSIESEVMTRSYLLRRKCCKNSLFEMHRTTIS